MTNDGQGNYRLSPREKQVLSLICQGLPYKQIGAELEIANNTVYGIAARLMAAFQCKTRDSLAAKFAGPGQVGAEIKAA